MSSIAYICSLVSPTLKPPMAYPGKSSPDRYSALWRRRSGKIPPCTMPNSAWSPRACVRRQRSAQACVRASACSLYARLLGSAHSSRTMMMSAPSCSCARITVSGVKKCRDPSICERNSTPSSVTLRFSARLNTWNPPESVRMGPCHPMNLCKPPISATRSAPGRR